MKSYIFWSMRQLRLLIYQPTQFDREAPPAIRVGERGSARGELLRYLLKMLPCIVLLASLGNLVIGIVYDVRGFSFRWGPSYIGVVLGVIGGIGFGALFRVAFAVAGSVVDGVALGVGYGLAFGIMEDRMLASEMVEGGTGSLVLWLVVTVGVVAGVAAGAGVGVVARVARSRRGNVATGVWLGVMIGVVVAVAGSVMVAALSDSETPEDNARDKEMRTIALSVGIVVGIVDGAGMAAGLGVTRGVAFGIVFGATTGVAFSVGIGLVIGAVFGVAMGKVFGVTAGIAFPVAFWLIYFRLIAYPIHSLISTIVYLLSRRTADAAQAWRRCPVVWNEVIWLPLPFAGKLLALLARQDRQEGLRQIAFIAAERRLQRRVAVAASVEVAIGDLRADSVAEIAAVADKLNWTIEAAELPARLKTVLPRFDRAAGHVGQYLALHSLYRKGQALRRALEELGFLQLSLTAVHRDIGPRLMQVVNDWRKLLDVEWKALRERAEGTGEIPNPFVLGNPLAERKDNVFTGRQDVVRQIEQSILGAAQTPMILLHGPRRMGKTSILKQLPRLLGPDFAPADLDCQNPAVTGSEVTLLQKLSESLSDGLQRRRVNVATLTRRMLEREPFAVLDEWLDRVEGAMPKDMRALLCLDEYERLQATLDAGWGLAFLDAMRHILQHRPRIAMMFCGVHTLEELGPAWTDRFISARRIRVSFLTREEVLPLLTEPIPEFDMTYGPGALDVIFTATNGHPFLTQAVAFELVEFMNEQKRREATPDDVEEAIARALVRAGAYFANVWNDAGHDGQAILLAVVKGETPPGFPSSRTWLREHDVLNENGEFTMPMVERWVRESKT